MSTKTTDSTLACLHGIRALSLFWVILAHRAYVSELYDSSRHLASRTSDWVQLYFSQVLLNSFLVVEVFIFMGGLVHSYVRTRKEKSEKDNSRKMNIGYMKIIIFRLWRLYPAYICSILLVFLMTPRGPLAPISQELLVKKCEKYWWRNLLFIHNFFKFDDLCSENTWYLSADMQLFLVSLFPVGLLAKDRKKGLIVNVVLLMSGILISSIWIFVKNAAPTSLVYEPIYEEQQIFKQIYASPFPHVAPYFAGVLLGYFLASKKNVKISKIYQVIGWSVAALCIISMLFMTQKWNSGGEYTRLESALYFSFSRLLFTLGVGWMILCCTTGYGGIINYILSMKVWVTLSRMSYMMYLVSYILQAFYAANLRTSGDVHEMILIWQYMGDISITFLLSLPLVVLVESPVIALQNLLIRRKTKEIKHSTNSPENIHNGVIKTIEVTQLELEQNGKPHITRF